MTALFSIHEWCEDRKMLRHHFLKTQGWHHIEMIPVGEDCAFRRYSRLQKNGRSVLLMEALPDDHEWATPGHRLKDFIRIGRLLQDAGLHTPVIYAADEDNGYVLLEDFGDMSFKRFLATGADQNTLYDIAVDILIRFRDLPVMALPDYRQSHVHHGRRRVVDWYMPLIRHCKNPDGLAEDYLTIWQKIEDSLPPCPQGFLHIDYHLENLMWCADAKGVARCGILDFQGAMHGALAYDLANLLEDVRHNVPPEIRRTMMERYCAGMNAEDTEIFKIWYRILATQFHCRVAGQFIRLAVRDGKDRYLSYLPQVQHYLREGLAHPILKPLQIWFSEQGIDFESETVAISNGVEHLIHDDAF